MESKTGYPIMQVMDALGKGLSPGARQALVVWLGGCAGWVFSMVVLGGMTRLTRSGLSMTDWKFTGERAPRSQVEPLSLQLAACHDCACIRVIVCVSGPQEVADQCVSEHLRMSELGACHQGWVVADKLL